MERLQTFLGDDTICEMCEKISQNSKEDVVAMTIHIKAPTTKDVDTRYLSELINSKMPTTNSHLQVRCKELDNFLRLVHNLQNYWYIFPFSWFSSYKTYQSVLNHGLFIRLEIIGLSMDA